MGDDLDALPVTVLLPTEPGIPLTVLDGNAALRMAVVDRVSISELDDTSDQPGLYVPDPVALDRRFGVYVGKAPAGLRARLVNHRRKKGDWPRGAADRPRHHLQLGRRAGRLAPGLARRRDALQRQPAARRDVRPYDRAALEAAVQPVRRTAAPSAAMRTPGRSCLR